MRPLPARLLCHDVEGAGRDWSRYPRAYARGTSSKPEAQLHLALCDLFLKFPISLNHGFIDAHRRGEEPYRPELLAPIYLLESWKPRSHCATRVRFEFPNDGRHCVLRRNHQDQMHRVNLETELLDDHIWVKLLNCGECYPGNALPRPYHKRLC